VDAIKGLIDERHAAAVRSGDANEAAWLIKQRERVNPYGEPYEVLSAELDAIQSAGRARIVARCAGPVITVLYLAGSVGYDTYRWSSGEIQGSELIVQVGKTVSVFTLGYATAYLASKSVWLAASPYRCGGIVSAVIFLSEEGWMIHQYGGFSAAFADPVFFVKTGGNLGAAVLGTIGFVEGGKLGAVIGTPFGPIGVTVGGAIGAVVGGAVGGIAGYLGGAALTDRLLQTLSPKLYYGMKLEEIEKAEKRFSENTERLLDLSHPLMPMAGTQ
jgi:hypothetical protein